MYELMDLAGAFVGGWASCLALVCFMEKRIVWGTVNLAIVCLEVIIIW
jgi:hypothetical protein